ncbi:pre-mRNA processing RNA-helicase [Sorochytrium milnesiophthora]
MTIAETEEEQKQRLRREKAEKWKRDREAKKLAASATGADNGVADMQVTSDTLTSNGKRLHAAVDASTANGDPKMAESSLKRFKQNDATAVPAAPKHAVQKGAPPEAVATQPESHVDEDSLDAFMVDVSAEVQKLKQEDLKRLKKTNGVSSAQNNGTARDDGADSEGGDEDDDILAYAAKKLAKKKDLAATDHSTIEYEYFKKDFYIEPKELAEMSNQEAQALRDELDGIKVAGKNCPKPVTKWMYCGLPLSCLEIIKKSGFAAPTPIQAQALPAIMSGRDVIGIAKTGSGKTLAFLLPLLRHVKDQRPLAPMEGPIALIMTPTRELAMQIHKECKVYGKVLGIRSLCAYGGSAIKDQIADLKRGAEVVVCTPGRMIDLLCANSGRVTNLRRVTYLVLDEADRMFDMGFEPQVMKIVNNVRPTRQTVLFSATFPRQMEALARKILRRPLEITVGGKSVVCQDVTQIVEVRDEDSKFVRLLEVLGQWFEKDKSSRVLIFVDRQDAADTMLSNLLRRGYMCMSLHGGKDQMDRDSTISDFKSGVASVLIATSVAARGLDVKGLNLVVNYDCPNHKEDYVHRVGRTGRAGNKGTAITFVTPDQDRYASDLADALKASGATVPAPLQELAEAFRDKVKAGQATKASSGFGGKGLERFDNARDVLKKAQKLAAGIVDEESSDDEPAAVAEDAADSAPQVNGQTKTGTDGRKDSAGTSGELTVAAKAAQEAAARIAEQNPGLARAQSIISQLNLKFRNQQGGASGTASSSDAAASVYNFTDEVEINDYPQKARWRVTNKEQISQISEISGAAITTRGTFFEPGKQPKDGERKLYLFLEGETQLALDKAKSEIARVLKEATIASVEMELKSGISGRYSVV